MSYRRYWFPAKRYGWGWGLPSTWEGWAVLIGYFGLFWYGFRLYPPTTAHIQFLIYMAVITVALIAICWMKGEPPRWRWGR